MLSDFLQYLLAKLELTSPWELLAVFLALAYLALAAKRSLWCWVCGFASSVIYVPLLFEWRLYMEAVLNIFYAAMSVYGYFEWRKGRNASGEMTLTQWRLRTHGYVFVAVMLATLINGRILSNTDAAYPYVDSFVTWGSVITTWMVARRVTENWLYWLVVDGIATGVYFLRGRVATGILFVIYVCIVIRGYIVWRRASRSETALQSALPTNSAAAKKNLLAN